MSCKVRKRAGLMNHDCPNGAQDGLKFGCMCEYLVCLKHGQVLKQCSGKRRSAVFTFAPVGETKGNE